MQEELTDESKDEDGTMQKDIERLTAVYTGFAEEKKDQFTSIGTSLGDILQKVLTLDHENKKQKVIRDRTSMMTAKGALLSLP